MSPFLFSADHANSDLGARFRSAITVDEALTLSISEVFAEYAEARQSGDPKFVARAEARLDSALDGYNRNAK